MLRGHYGADLRAARRTRTGAVLLHAAVAATVGLASAISGGAVALHLAAPPPAGQFLPRSAIGATKAAAAAPLEKSGLAADALPSPPQTGAADIVSDAVAATPAAALAASVSLPLTERELTFAWGYAQRHPGGPARPAEARAAPSLAGAHAMAPRSVPRRPGERQRASVAQREPIAVAQTASFHGFDGDAHRTLGNGRSDRRMDVDFPAERNRPGRATALRASRNHETPRS